ncbi:uncharacterized protein NPIL_542711, partial [Nephila pilipes]
MDSEFERCLSLIFPPNEFPVIHDTLLHFDWLPNPYHHESFRQHCMDTGYRMDQECEEKNLLRGTWNGFTYAYLVGFLHDIGKPFVQRINCFGGQSFTGHAQVGARLVMLRFENHIPNEVLFTMGFLIDAHMCCLQSRTKPVECAIRANAVLHLYLPSSPNLLPLLQCLHRADHLSKQPPSVVDWMEYLSDSPFPYRKDRRVVIFLIGPSGSGKSTIAQALAEELADCGTVLHLERDQCLMSLALEGESYSQCYARIHKDPALKKKFQTLWKDSVASASADIILVDTVQTYYWRSTIEFEHCFRIGVYCVPLHLIDASLHGKNPHVEFPPKKWAGYPNLLTERYPWQLEMGTGLWNLVPSLVKRYLSQSWPETLDDHPSLAYLWNEYTDKYICAQFPHQGITFNVEYTVDGYKVYRATYPPGSDVTWGPTRFYRGEFLLMDDSTGSVSLLRSGLPTFTRKETTLHTFDTV